MKVSAIFLISTCLAISECTKLPANPLSIIQEEKPKIGNETWIWSPCPLDSEGIYQINVPGLEPFPVLCNAQIAGAGYIVIASRTNADLSFFRSWQEYKKGFGSLTKDFFIGLDKLHAITKSQTYELYIHLEDWQGQTRFARYDEFYIENENELYKLSTLGSFTGDAGDSLTKNKDQKFTTYDKDNDLWTSGNCAINRIGAWWYNSCTNSNLFGTYVGDPSGRSLEIEAISWDHWHEVYSYKTVKMLVRPKCGCSP